MLPIIRNDTPLVKGLNERHSARKLSLTWGGVGPDLGLISRGAPLYLSMSLMEPYRRASHLLLFLFRAVCTLYNKCNHLADSGPCVGRNHLGEAITRGKKLSGLLTYPTITRLRPDELLKQK